MSLHTTHPLLEEGIKKPLKRRLYHGSLAGSLLADNLDITLLIIIFSLGSVGIYASVAHSDRMVDTIIITCLSVFAAITVFFRIKMRPDRLRALQAERLLSIVSKTSALLHEGLDYETAMRVCEVIESELPKVVAVALTDGDVVLGFAGLGCESHAQWRVIASDWTRKALEEKNAQVIESINCATGGCPLKSAIIVPLLVEGEAVGTLKFYYADSYDLTEIELAIVQGLGEMMSSQLEMNALEDEAHLVREMELKMLQAQINPHFLFNTLNTIASLTRTDAESARKMILNFAQFYRHTLENKETEVTLSDSVDFMVNYFYLEQARFGDRVRLTLDIDPRLLEVKMPAFMLQPLVENSISHGMREDGSPLHIHVSVVLVAIDGAFFIRFTITDDGRGVDAKTIETVLNDSSRSKGLGMALRNVRTRLLHYYGSEADMEFSSKEGNGTKVVFHVPYRLPEK